ncbi:hypothetical protein [Streptomyces albicerus]|uniref:hypothetical protein n=1 Tax=Streptomyces albicerus TaxID=2569859 RepID=UPI00124B6AB5|nr:hypothetical protein [Streptomyces albicerus]
MVWFARRHAGGFENLPAVAAEALRATRPRNAKLLASLAAAELGRRGHAVGGRATYGAVYALVAANRMVDARRIAETMPEFGDH